MLGGRKLFYLTVFGPTDTWLLIRGESRRPDSAPSPGPGSEESAREDRTAGSGIKAYLASASSLVITAE